MQPEVSSTAVLLQATFDSATAEVVFLVARVLFGGVLAFMGLNHFLNGDQMAGYADAKGVPAAEVMVPLSGGMLLLGGLSVVTGAFPVLGAGALAVFLLVSTPTMHDFWAAPEEQQQTEMTQFLKNVALVGGALAFLALGGGAWPFAVEMTAL
ncbi:DoxX family protein [Halomarina rubra]|uniref:DoxX family protein n=1 Tax=Halomarina rubra TaxID=2071873 RepID=A0ABD6B0Y0_9EURY|nr:DoxX family protein [Halomarina rubra]